MILNIDVFNYIYIILIMLEVNLSFYYIWYLIYLLNLSEIADLLYIKLFIWDI